MGKWVNKSTAAEVINLFLRTILDIQKIFLILYKLEHFIFLTSGKTITVMQKEISSKEETGKNDFVIFYNFFYTWKWQSIGVSVYSKNYQINL
jgi:hypothetical protein